MPTVTQGQVSPPPLPVMVPYLALLLLVGPLLFLNGGQTSLMAHDEGYYALQARWILDYGDWVTVRWWDAPLYDRAIGIQWLIALCFQVFGVSATAARLPSMVACLVSVGLTYSLGKQLLSPRQAWLGAAILGVTPLWVQYGQLATQDLTLVCLELVAVWALLQGAKSNSQPCRWCWAILAGLLPGLGFLIKGFMVALPPIALLPYLLGTQRQHRHLSHPGLYVGLVSGSLPPLFWLWQSWLKYGGLPWQQLTGKLFTLGTQGWQGTTPLYYLWNLPANAFPWMLFTVLGTLVLLRQQLLLRQQHDPKRTANHSRKQAQLLLLIGYPLVFFLLLSSFKTRTPYYGLQLLPFTSLLAGVALDGIWTRFQQPGRSRWLLAGLSYSFGGLGLLLLLAVSALWLGVPLPGLEVGNYMAAGFGLGLGWLCLPILWLGRTWWWFSSVGWLTSWLLAPWLALAIVASQGVLADHSAEVRRALAQPAIATVVQTQPSNFVFAGELTGDEHKTLILLGFAASKLGRHYPQLAEVPANRYAWLSPDAGTPKTRELSVGSVLGWQLVPTTPQIAITPTAITQTRTDHRENSSAQQPTQSP